MSSSSSSGSGSSSSGYPQFLRPFHPAEAALAQEQLHSGMGRFDFGGSSSGGSAGVIGGVVTPAPERIFCCGECGKRFKKRGHLIQHSVTHSENRPFVCNICQKRPRKPREKRDPSTIVRRRRSPAPAGDGSERPYSCHICGKRFRRAETLRRHNRVHTGEKPHACDVCGKMFREPFHLTKHLTVHSGQKNYKCNLCGKMFAYAQSLVRHGKLHRKGEIDNQGRRIKGAAAAAISQVANSANADYFTSCSQGEKSPTSGTPSQSWWASLSVKTPAGS
uniref:C2H2-type domain-containing protein n=1 Tax=Dicentrarchus labrax TaxID=13489 RepID=A0A8P4KA96_DICLA